MPHCNTFSIPPLRHRLPVPYPMLHNKMNFTPHNHKLNIPQSINNFSQEMTPRLTIDNNNNNTPLFKMSNSIGQSNSSEIAQEMQLGNSIGPTLSEDLYKHPLPRGNYLLLFTYCLYTYTKRCNIGGLPVKSENNIPESSNGCHDPSTPDTPNIERLDSVSTPSPAPLTPIEGMDTNGKQQQQQQ